MNTVLQISTAQGPAECQMFARFVLQRLLAEAEQQGIAADVQAALESKHGILSAVVGLAARLPKPWPNAGWARCNGFAPAPCGQNIRAKTGMSACSACRMCRRCRMMVPCVCKLAAPAAKVASM